jgi:hypothetical protein
MLHTCLYACVRKARALVAGCVLSLFSLPVFSANALDDELFNYLFAACFEDAAGPVAGQLQEMCNTAFSVSSGGGAPVVAFGMGASGSQRRPSSLEAIEDRLEELEEKKAEGKSKSKSKRKGGGAGAGDGGLGFLVSTQSGEAERKATDFGNAFESELSAHTIGVDYLFDNSFVLGVAFSKLEDEGDIAGSAGSFLTENTSTLLYGSWAMGGGLGLGFYHGSSDNDYQNSRAVEMGSISGAIDGDFSGEQSLSGVSLDYDLALGSLSLGTYYAIDKIDTDIDAYTETGLDPETGEPTLLEFVFPGQKIKSETGRLGLRASYAFNTGWGALIPGIEYAAVKENKDDKRFIPVHFPFAPDYIFTIETDAPDREYAFQTFNLLAAFNGGSQFFLSCEQRSGHKFLEDSAIMVGAIFNF